MRNLKGRRRGSWRFALTVGGAVLGAMLLVPPLWFAVFSKPPPELPAAGRRVAVAPGVAVNLIEQGEGRPIVLVHGHPGCAYDWTVLMNELMARRQHTLAYDRVGYGRSDERGVPIYTVAANADDLLALLVAEDLRDAVVVGWSYGGGTAIAAARKDSSRIARLFLLGSVGPGIEHRDGPPAFVMEFMAGPGLSWLARVPPLADLLRVVLTKQAFHPDAIAPGYLDQLAANFARPHTLSTFRSEGRDLGGEADLDPVDLRLPIFVIHGDADQLVPIDVGRELHRRAQDSHLWVVENGGHMLPITHAKAVADRIAAFASTP